MIKGLSRGKQKRKNTFLSFFSNRSFYLFDSRRWEFSHSICSQIQTVPIRNRCLCLLCRDKGHDHIIMNTGSRLRKRLQSKGISQKPFIPNNHADDQYKKNWPSLKDNSLSCIRYVWQYCFPKNRIVLPRARRLFPGNASHSADTSTVHTTLAYCCMLVDFSIRGLK
jgi:hypothetical protein